VNRGTPGKRGAMRGRVLFLCLLLGASGLDARIWVLEAQAHYSNSGSERFESVHHRVTLPGDTPFQKLRAIETDGPAYVIKKHTRGDDAYAEIQFDVPPFTEVEHTLRFTVETEEAAFAVNPPQKPYGPDAAAFLNADALIQSDAREIRAVASLIGKGEYGFEGKIRAAFEFVGAYIEYRVQPRSSALEALHTARGDCTEFAMLMSALSRALGVPARVVSAFNVKRVRQLSIPNHHMVELYIEPYGWVPFYPNLGRGQAAGEFAPGRVSEDVIRYKSTGWTWANTLPSDSAAKGLNVKMSWRAEPREP